MADSDTMVVRLVERLERLTLAQMRCIGKRLIEQGVEERHRWPEIERADLWGANQRFGYRIGALKTLIRAESPQSVEEDYEGFPMVVDRELARALDQSGIALQALLLGDTMAAAPVLEILDRCAPEAP